MTQAFNPTPSQTAQHLRDAVEHDLPGGGMMKLALAHLLDACTWREEQAELQRQLQEANDRAARALSTLHARSAELENVRADLTRYERAALTFDRAISLLEEDGRDAAASFLRRYA